MDKCVSDSLWNTEMAVRVALDEKTSPLLRLQSISDAIEALKNAQSILTPLVITNNQLVFTMESDGKEQTYEGFSGCLTADVSSDFNTLDEPPTTTKHLVIAPNREGDNLEVELFWLENDNSALEEFLRYRRSEYVMPDAVYLFELERRIECGS